MARPRKEIDIEQLKSFMRLKPTKADTAAFFDVSETILDERIKENFGVNFRTFRDQRMVHTRFSLVRKAIQMAEKGDRTMLIFCLKNLCNWSDQGTLEDEDDRMVYRRPDYLRDGGQDPDPESEGNDDGPGDPPPSPEA